MRTELNKMPGRWQRLRTRLRPACQSRPEYGGQDHPPVRRNRVTAGLAFHLFSPLLANHSTATHMLPPTWTSTLDHWMVFTGSPRGDWSVGVGQDPQELLNLKLNYFSQLQCIDPLPPHHTFIHPAIFTENLLCAWHCLRHC